MVALSIPSPVEYAPAAQAPETPVLTEVTAEEEHAGTAVAVVVVTPVVVVPTTAPVTEVVVEATTMAPWLLPMQE